eukprot:m.534877 g.534877  ORF g.534877 m.534877 type:complete len:76 (+) comp22059_c0_seq19:2153-2380(+)
MQVHPMLPIHRGFLPERARMVGQGGCAAVMNTCSATWTEPRLLEHRLAFGTGREHVHVNTKRQSLCWKTSSMWET